jgi:hypothetical protein
MESKEQERQWRSEGGNDNTTTVFAYKWLIHNSCDKRNGTNLEILNKRSGRNLSSLTLYSWDYRSMLLLCHALVRGFTARGRAAAKWRSTARLVDKGRVERCYSILWAQNAKPLEQWSGVVQMWCASNRCDHGAVGTTVAMLDSWERFSNPPYNLELVPLGLSCVC